MRFYYARNQSGGVLDFACLDTGKAQLEAVRILLAVRYYLDTALRELFMKARLLERLLQGHLDGKRGFQQLYLRFCRHIFF